MSELKLKARVTTAEESSRRLADELEVQQRNISMIEAEKVDLMEALATRDTELEALQQEMGRLVTSREEVAREKLELEIRAVQLEEERDRLEGDKLQMAETQHTLEADHKEKLLPLEQLQKDFDELSARHEQFSHEHASALEKSRLYDQDMLDKSRKIKDQAIELKTLENLLYDKTKEMSHQIIDLDTKEKTLISAKETISNFENVISAKELEIETLKSLMSDSSDHSKMMELKNTCDQLRNDLNLVMEERIILEQTVAEKKQLLDTLDMHSTSVNADLENTKFELTKVRQEFRNVSEKVANLEDVIESKTLELEEEKQRTEQLSGKINELTEEQRINDGLAKRIQTLEKEKLEESETSKKYLDELNQQKEENEKLVSQLKQSSTERTEVIARLSAKDNELAALKDKLLSKEESLCSVNLLKEEIKALKEQLSLKDGDIACANEEITNKYSIIENLQLEITRFEESCSSLLSTNVGLEAQIKILEGEKRSLMEDMTSKSNSLEMLQTTIEVLESNQSEFGSLSQQLPSLQQSILGKESEIIALQRDLELEMKEKTDLLTSKEKLEEKVSFLKDELQNSNQVSELTDYKQQLMAKEEEIKSLEEKLTHKSIELASSVTEDSLFTQQQSEQNEMLREKCKQLESSKSYQDLVSQLKENVKELESKNRDIEKLRDIIRKLEVDNKTLESTISEIEQFRQMLSKESNQHMEEASEKIRELKSQLDSRQEEIGRLLEEKDIFQKDLVTAETTVKTFEAKYNDVLKTSSEAELIRDRDQFKEKNEKLTGMCKKYIAKIKQLDSQLKQSETSVDNSQIEEFNNKITSLELELQESISGNVVLQEEMMSKYQIIDDLQSQIADANTELEKTSAKFEELQASSQHRQQENEELVRSLKQKLEDTPENISVAVNVADSAAEHEKTKAELNNIREKCKKLIVKVKQQDAIIKKKRHESNSSEISTSAEESSSEEIGKLKKASNDLEIANDSLKRELKELKQVSMLVETSKNELEAEHSKLLEKIEKYEQKFKDSEEKKQIKINEYKKQIAQLTSEQVELKDVMKEMSSKNHQLKVKAEEAEEEVKRMHEANLVRQMEASPLLAEVVAEDKYGGCEEDIEGEWGSPEPENPKPTLVSESEEAQEAESDGWAGWGDERDEEENIKLDDDGLKNVDAKEEDQDKESVKNLVEREADIEDGWGDDSWGGFGEEEAVGTESGLADNLR